MSAYPISSRDYLARARVQLAAGNLQALFYAALELRCGVEARLQEHLEPHSHIPESRRTEWRPGKLHRTTIEAFKLGDQVARVRIVHQDSGALITTLFYTPVSARLKTLAEKLGSYLHAAKTVRPADDPFWTSFRDELEEAAQLLTDATTGTLLGPILRRSGSAQVTMPMEVTSGDLLDSEAFAELKGANVVLDIQYFPDIRTARSGAG